MDHEEIYRSELYAKDKLRILVDNYYADKTACSTFLYFRNCRIMFVKFEHSFKSKNGIITHNIRIIYRTDMWKWRQMDVNSTPNSLMGHLTYFFLITARRVCNKMAEWPPETPGLCTFHENAIVVARSVFGINELHFEHPDTGARFVVHLHRSTVSCVFRDLDNGRFRVLVKCRSDENDIVQWANGLENAAKLAMEIICKHPASKLPTALASSIAPLATVATSTAQNLPIAVSVGDEV